MEHANQGMRTPWLIHVAAGFYLLPSLVGLYFLITTYDEPFWSSTIPVLLTFSVASMVWMYARRQHLRVAVVTLSVCGGITLGIFLICPFLSLFFSVDYFGLLSSLIVSIIAQVLTIPGAICLLLPPVRRWYQADLPRKTVQRFW